MYNIEYSLQDFTVVETNEFSDDEPYLWVFWILIDAETLPRGRCVFPMGNPHHANISSAGFPVGRTARIPRNVGWFSRRFTPIQAENHLTAMTGVLVLAWEGDKTPNDKVEQAYNRTKDLLDKAIRERINQFNFDKFSDVDQSALKNQIEKAIRDIYASAVKWYDPTSWDPDDAIGSATKLLSLAELPYAHAPLNFSFRGGGARYSVSGTFGMFLKGTNGSDLMVRDERGQLTLYPFLAKSFTNRTPVGHGFNFTHYFPGKWSADGTADLIVRDEQGRLFKYPFENQTFGTRVEVGHGFNFTHYFVGRWTGNGTDDLIVRNAEGKLFLYPFRNGAFDQGAEVGHGFDFTHYLVGSWTGDGTDDLIVRNAEGKLFLYAFRNGTFGRGAEAGHGFDFTHYLVGSWTGDGTDDLVVRNAEGKLFLYPFRNGAFDEGVEVGHGFHFTHYFVGRWTDDGTDDLIVRNAEGKLFLYPFRNRTFAEGAQVGNGFDFTHYFVEHWVK